MLYPCIDIHALDDDEEEADEWAVEDILKRENRKHVFDDGETRYATCYFVKWVGYESKFNTWEPFENLRGSLDMVREFNRQWRKKKGSKRSRGNSTGPDDAPKSASRRKGLRTSNVWDCFREETGDEGKSVRCVLTWESVDHTKTRPGKAVKITHKCDWVVHRYSEHTNTLWDHLRSKHNSVYVFMKGTDKTLQEYEDNQQAKRPDVMSMLTSPSVRRPYLGSALELQNTTFTRWVCARNRPFKVGEDKELKAYIQQVSGGRAVPPSADVVRRIVKEQAAVGIKNASEVVELLRRQGIKICIQGDIWSKKRKSLFGILGTGILESCGAAGLAKWEMVEVLLGLVPAAKDPHTGAWILHSTEEQMKLVGISSAQEVFAACSDNASNIKCGWRKFGLTACAAHTWQLAIKMMNTNAYVKDLFRRMRKVVGHFHRSVKDAALLSKKQVGIVKFNRDRH